MRVAIVNDKSGTPKIHAAGCRDLDKARGHGDYISEEEWPSRTAFLADYYAAHLASDPLYTIEDAFGWAVFKPCCKLPVS